MKRKIRLSNTGKYMFFRNCSIFIFVAIFIFIGTGYALLNTQVVIEGKATMMTNNLVIKEEVGISKSTAIVKLDTSWKSNYMITLTINNQDANYNLWEVTFDIPDGVNKVESSNKGDVEITVVENTVTISKVTQDWASSWPLNYDNGFLQINFVFDEEVDFTISNLIFNNKLITDIEYSNMSAPISINGSNTINEIENVNKIENAVKSVNKINIENSLEENLKIDNSINKLKENIINEITKE